MDTLVFVEVRSTASGELIRPALSIDAKKQRRLWRLAQYLIKKHQLPCCPARFDVLLLLTSATSPELDPKLPPNSAFQKVTDPQGHRVWLIHYPDAWRSEE
ncbi:hypothetical protein HRbin36_01141 [bacterium HR36]|nr:hypothetical protein HRbin36_01141 [bacterium HR36]